MQYLLKVHDDGQGVKKITGSRIIGDTDLYDDVKFIKVTKEIYDYVMDAYPLYEMTFPDTISSDLMLDQITKSIVEGIDGFKNDAQFTYVFRELRNENINIDFMIMSIKFMLLNNRLANKGYLFTEENKEQLYLDILNSGDEALVGILDDYLVVLDYILEYENKIDIYLNMKKKLSAAQSLQEIQTIYNEATGRDFFVDLNS